MHAPCGGLDGAGIMFNDITTLLLRPGVFKDAVDLFVERYRGMGIDAVAGNHQRKPRPPDDTSPLLLLLSVIHLIIFNAINIVHLVIILLIFILLGHSPGGIRLPE